MSPEPETRTVASKSNFYYSFLFLPRPQQEAIHQVYRFCRVIDDVADSDLPRNEKKTLLDEWRKELADCFSGHPRHPVMKPLLESVRTFGLSRKYFEELIDGVEMDLTGLRYESFEGLSRYCYGVAGTVGLLCVQIFGVPLERYRDYAIRLGTAFQLTNILRDLKPDAARGRIYLPLEDLRRFGYPESDLLKGVYSDPFIRLMEFETGRARDFYQAAHQLIRPDDRKRLLPAEIMTGIYGSILDRIRAVRFNVFENEISLPSYQKVWIAVSKKLSVSFPAL
jgi:15-cis-phytoene synthase